jgi:DNA (cytosine-5)-methyltransferase 1
MTDVASPTVLSMFAGGGGMDIGFRMAVPGARTICYIEREASAAALLVAQIQAGRLADAPIWSDALTFSGGAWSGKVDWIIASPPCQPFSFAGVQKAFDDRNLWPVTLKLVADIQPAGCFFENVNSAAALWDIYQVVLPGLQVLGYKTTIGIFGAQEVGAPHRRQRVFILAYDEELADPDGSRQRNEIDPNGAWPNAVEASHRLEWPPKRTDYDGWARVLAERPDFAPLESGLCGVADGMAERMGLDRTEQIRVLGNAVIPKQAARGFEVLWHQLYRQPHELPTQKPPA